MQSFQTSFLNPARRLRNGAARLAATGALLGLAFSVPPVLAAAPPEAEDRVDPSGSWSAWVWDGESAPVRYRLRIDGAQNNGSAPRNPGIAATAELQRGARIARSFAVANSPGGRPESNVLRVESRGPDRLVAEFSGPDGRLVRIPFLRED